MHGENKDNSRSIGDQEGGYTCKSKNSNEYNGLPYKIQDQVDKGFLPADRVVDSELHPIVVEARDALVIHQAGKDHEVIKEPTAKQNEEEWHTVMTRKKAAQLKKDGTGV
ncbi:hypothetical protein RIF29_03829 [Crotalaria pallida]|uniref:Uncharacterized protein n=1 Tax=Crotalaria pallida TaxID=3830 RepID=A0AAN9P9I5_CROPI